METKCTIQVTWPYEASFSSVASNKKTAAKNASLQCLNWLYKCKKIKQKGLKPILYDHQNENNFLNSQKYLSIDLTSHLKIEIQSLIDTFDKVIIKFTNRNMYLIYKNILIYYMIMIVGNKIYNNNAMYY